MAQLIGVAIGAIVVVAIALFGSVVLGTLFGGVAGWVAGQFFGDQILAVVNQLGIHDVTMFQLGLFLGFVGGFFRGAVTNKAGSK